MKDVTIADMKNLNRKKVDALIKTLFNSSEMLIRMEIDEEAKAAEEYTRKISIESPVTPEEWLLTNK